MAPCQNFISHQITHVQKLEKYEWKKNENCFMKMFASRSKIIRRHTISIVITSKTPQNIAIPIFRTIFRLNF